MFVDGGFWHGCPKCYRRPGSNRAYWDAKIQRNRKRDRQVARQLRRAEWQVLRIWEHQLSGKTRDRVPEIVRRALSAASTNWLTAQGQGAVPVQRFGESFIDVMKKHSEPMMDYCEFFETQEEASAARVLRELVKNQRLG